MRKYNDKRGGVKQRRHLNMAGRRVFAGGWGIRQDV